MERHIITTILAAVLCCIPAGAQKAALSTNAAGYIYLGTASLDAQYAVAGNFSLEAAARLNPWTFREGDPDRQFENRQQSYSLGGRYWPWYTYSGWWLGAAVQYQEYNRGGIGTPVTEEGDALGMVLRAGYSLHVNRWLNVDFGLAGWGGITKYTTYACPFCGQRLDQGSKYFFLPDDIIISAMFVF